MQHRNTHFIAAFMTLCVVCSCMADVVTLRPTVRVPRNAVITLRDVASLDGNALEKFAPLEVGHSEAGAFELSAEVLRSKLARAGADLKTVRFIGEKTVVRPLTAPNTTTAVALGTPRAEPVAAPAQPIARAAKPADTLIEPRAHAEQSTPLGIICNLISSAFDSESTTMRLSLREDDLAKLAVKPGFRYEIVTRSALRTDRVDMEVVAYEGVKVASRERVRVEPRLARTVCVSSCDLRRGTALDTASFKSEVRFVAPSMASRLADEADVRSSTLARSVEADSIIEEPDLARELAIHRNDHVMIRREVGMVAIEIEAIAMEDGSTGDIIALQRTGTARTRDALALSAEVVGRGRAVIR